MTSAATGALAGGGLMLPALIGSCAVIAANIFLRPVGRTLDRHRRPSSEESSAEYRFEVRCATSAEVHIRRLIFAAISHPNHTVRSISAVDLPDDEGARITATVIADERDDHRIEAALADAIKAPAVTAVRWTADDMSSVD